MVLEPSVVELSSSDDEEEDHSQGRNVWPGPSGTEPDFFKVGNMDMEDDDVMIINEPNNTGAAKRDKPRPIRTVMDDDDDECRMLDTDPGATETTEVVPSYDSGDLIMIGEKGPVACRDFPHGRYLCVHHPFKTTPHAKFCAQCHCYVCDSLAPCTQWGDGSSSNDHCHASEEARWKSLRKLAKCGLLPSRAMPNTATPAAPTAAPLSNINRMGNSTGATRFAHSGALLDASSTSPTSPSVFSQSPPGHPVGSGISRQVQGISSTVKKDPLIIKLKGKARGKTFQPPHLGVRTPRYVPRNRSTLPSPRSAPAPSGRIRDEVSPSGVQSPYPPQFAPNSHPGPGRAGSGTAADMPPHQSHPVPAFKTVPGRAVMPPPVQFSLPNVAPYYSALPPPPPNNPPPVDFSRTTVNSNVGSRYYPASAHAPGPPLPDSPPPYIPPPPSGAYNHSVSSGYDYPPPGVFDHNLGRLPGGADATVAGFVPPDSHIPDSRYVPISALSIQQVTCNINTAPFYEGHSNGQPYNHLAQGYRSPVDSAHYPSSSYISSNGGNADILAGATEGWVDDVTAHFDSFGTIGAAPDHDQQAASSSLNDVLEQMAGDDYLWEQFPSW